MPAMLLPYGFEASSERTAASPDAVLPSPDDRARKATASGNATKEEITTAFKAATVGSRLRLTALMSAVSKLMPGPRMR
jgi:hypothetical protein